MSIGVLILRKRSPEMERPFKTPLVPLVPILGAVICLGMIVAIDVRTLQFALGWMILGLLVYCGYSRKRSRLEQPGEILPKASDFN